MESALKVTVQQFHPPPKPGGTMRYAVWGVAITPYIRERAQQEPNIFFTIRSVLRKKWTRDRFYAAAKTAVVPPYT